MYPKRSNQGDELVGPVRTSDRLRRRPKSYGRPYIYYTPTIIRPKRSKTKTRTAASQIAKMLRPVNRPVRTSKEDSGATNLRRSTRKRRISVNLNGFDTDNSEEDDDNDLMRPTYRSSRTRRENNNNNNNNSASQDELTPRREGLRPRRQGLRPRFSRTRQRVNSESESSDEKVGPDDEPPENGTHVVDNDEEEGEEGEEGEEDGDDEEEPRRRYDLRNRSGPGNGPGPEVSQRTRSPRRVLQQGVGPTVRRGGGGSSRNHKRHRVRENDSDDSLLVDEMDQGLNIPWGGGNRNTRAGPPWLLSGLDSTTNVGLNIAASGWGHQNDTTNPSLTSGIQTAGPSSKGGADIQPLQIDDSVSFNDIGGLSEYIDALKEMVFFPLLYPDFFASYNITPPRGVLLCGPPGTGKTLVARALACSASKAGQKVSFYMRKGADVLSKWVGEAERQLKLLFEEAQKNQPSIIFFDEIDGLAPVRSSKQEQIHNSIVSTLLALMDGLDSRGQVVLIGATNRVDAIDGALRRPGRFDREFNFSLPGCEARSEILTIHTRKWRDPPSKELILELATSCVGYCGADLKALCTEAAIRAFREKYPQVYTSDDKFLIDVESVKVENYHFIEAMGSITPAAHRGSIVHSRPLSMVVSSCLKRHLDKAMGYISDIFPAIESSFEKGLKLSMVSYGSAIPLVYRPRFLLCGVAGTGLDHLGPAILHEMEKFPVHSLGLPSLLSDPGAKTPEEALVHIFSEARRNTPSILYISQFNLWWENAHEQLKAVLRTLLEELPSDLPILLFGTSSVPFDELGDIDSSSVFASHNVFNLTEPTTEDRSMFFHCLIEAALSIQSENTLKKSRKTLPELPKAPKIVTGPKISELKAKAEAQGHALRRLRMCLRDICNRILYDKKFSMFHYPVLDEDAPNYRTIIQNPMDIATLLQRVDSGKYITCKTFLDDFDLILTNAKKFNGDDYSGARIVSRAFELRDAVHGMLAQMDPALVTFTEKIAEEGGPTTMPEEEVEEGFTLPLTPITAHITSTTSTTTVTRASARLRNVQPEVNVDQSYEALKIKKKPIDNSHSGGLVSTPDEGSQPHDQSQPLNLNISDDPEPDVMEENIPENLSHKSNEKTSTHKDDVTMTDAELSSKVGSIKQVYVELTSGYGIPQLERLYTRIMKGVLETKNSVKGDDDDLKPLILDFLLKFSENKMNF